MFKQILVAAMFTLTLATNAHATGATPLTQTQVALQKQFTLNIAGVDLKGLDPAVDKARVECRIQMQGADFFGRNVLGSATVEFPVTQHLTYGGSVQSGPIALGINVGDGFHNAPQGSGVGDAHVWQCKLELHKGNEWAGVLWGTNGYCTPNWKWRCSLAGSPMENEPKGTF